MRHSPGCFPIHSLNSYPIRQTVAKPYENPWLANAAVRLLHFFIMSGYSWDNGGLPVKQTTLFMSLGHATDPKPQTNIQKE